MSARAVHEDIVDSVQLGVVGWRERYYAQKFGGPPGATPSAIRAVCQAYVEGLVWVFRYYYQGVASWKWFYPHHYAPFASDLRGLGGYSVTFELGRPFRPLDQLMGVLPAQSGPALPPAAAALMTGEGSPVRHFYPATFAQDPNGKRLAWQWVVLLPFIQERALIEAMDSVAHTFTPEEAARNELGNDVLLVHAEGCGVGAVVAPLALTRASAGALRDYTAPERQALIARTRARVLAEEAAVIVNVSAGYEGDATTVHTPTISPAVNEAMAMLEDLTAAAAAAAEGGGDGSSSSSSGLGSLTLRPRDGDSDGKGFTARILPLHCGSKSGYAVALGETFFPPAPEEGSASASAVDGAPACPPIPNCRTAAVTILPPTRRAHMCVRLPGAPTPRRTLTDADCPAGVVPRLSKGFSVADLARVALGGGGGGGGGGGAGGGGGGAGGRGGASFHQQQQYQQQMGQGVGSGAQYGTFHHHSSSFSHTAAFQASNWGAGGTTFIPAGAGAQQYQQQQQQQQPRFGGGLPMPQQQYYQPPQQQQQQQQHPLLNWSTVARGPSLPFLPQQQPMGFLPPGLPPPAMPMYHNPYQQQQQQQQQFMPFPPQAQFGGGGGAAQFPQGITPQQAAALAAMGMAPPGQQQGGFSFGPAGRR